MEPSKFQFIGYRISNIHFDLRDDYNPNINENMELNTNIDAEQKFFNEDKRLVEVTLKIDVNSQNESLKFSLIIKGGFKADADMSDNMFEKMSKINAPAILYPFARAIITSYTAQANVTPIILPTVNFATQNN